MKKQILISLILLCSVLTMNAQWNGTNPIWTNSTVGIGTDSPQNPLHIETSLSDRSILYGMNDQPMGTGANSYSPNLFLIHTRLDALFGLHAYAYRKTASTSWTGGTVRLSSSVDGAWYSQVNVNNNLNWIDFIGNQGGIDLGSGANDPSVSIRGKKIGIGTVSPIAPLHIESSLSDNSILYGANTQAMGTGANSYSPNLFLIHTRLDALFGLHAYVYRKTASTSWTGGTVRISSSADGAWYSQDNVNNNLNWIDFNGNQGGIDLGSGANGPSVSIRGTQVGIGTTSPAYKLDVAGTIRACEVKVDLLNGCDFVFKSNYKLMGLKELEKYVKTNEHLPEIASEKEMVENGVNMKELKMKLLQKMEEMTLYMIEQNKKLEQQHERIITLENEIKELKTK